MRTQLAKENGMGRKLLAVLMAAVLAVGVVLPTGALSVGEAWGAESVTVNGVTYATTSSNKVTLDASDTDYGSQTGVYTVSTTGASLTSSVGKASVDTVSNRTFPITGYTYIGAIIISSSGSAQIAQSINFGEYREGGGRNHEQETKTGWYYTENGNSTAIPSYSTILLVYAPGSVSSDGTINHLEVEIDATVELKMDLDEDGIIESNEVQEVTVGVNTNDSFTVTASYSEDGSSPFAAFVITDVVTGNGSTANSTVELTGLYPIGTKSNPIYYTISVSKTIQVETSAGTVSVPVTLTKTIHFWSSDNNCPGASSGSNNKYSEQGGIDVPLSAEAVLNAVTEGRLAIKKNVVDAEGSALSTTDAFSFTVQNKESLVIGEVTIPALSYLRVSSTGEVIGFAVWDSANKVYVLYDAAGSTVDSDGKAYGTSTALPSDCYVSITGNASKTLSSVPIGFYVITEVQKDGYIITDSEGNESDDYTVDYAVEERDNNEIENLPVAVFTNAQLSDDEAGISIKKTASGEIPEGVSYPSPTVTIYELNDDGTRVTVTSDGVTADKVVWSGVLTPNGDTYFLSATLEEGVTYEVVEEGAGVTGADLNPSFEVSNGTASVDVAETSEGFKFTVPANGGGTVYELTVVNEYSEVSGVVVSKSVSGNIGDLSKHFRFDIEVTCEELVGESTTITYGGSYSCTKSDGAENWHPTTQLSYDSEGVATATVYLKDGESVSLDGLPYGASVKVTEENSGYTTTTISKRDSSSGSAEDGSKVWTEVASYSGAQTSQVLTTTQTVTSGLEILFVNHNEANVDTGVSLESLPYLAVLGGVLACGTVLAGRAAMKRKED